MFTGIVEEVGQVKSIRKNGQALVLTIGASKVLEDVKKGDSIASNGVCLTVTDFKQDEFSVDAVEETIKKTNLYDLRPGDPINLERALQVNSRLGGHILQGHVDGLGQVRSIRKKKMSTIFEIGAKREIMDLVLAQGSIGINGISLTVSELGEESFKVSIIPTSLKETNLKNLRVGDLVNLETDLIGKYIKKYLDEQNTSKIDRKFLTINGF